MQNILSKLSPLLFFLLIFSCAKDHELSPAEPASTLLQAREGASAGKPCTIPCTAPEDIRVEKISACTAEIHWPYSGQICGTFTMQVQNLATGAWTYYNPVSTPYLLTGLDPCTDYKVGVSHLTDECSSLPITVSFQTTCGECKPCNVPCRAPDYAVVTNITDNSATAYFSFDEPTCGYFVAQLKNQSTGNYTYFNPAVSPLDLTGLDPCTVYTIGISHVTNLCASVPTPISFTTDCVPCEPTSEASDCIYNQYITLTVDQHPGVWTADPTMGYVDATNQELAVPAGAVLAGTGAGNCFCDDYAGMAYLKLWIDFNQNQLFEPTELMYSHMLNPSTGSGSSSTVSCFDFATPGFTMPNIEACGLLARYIISQDPIVGPCEDLAAGQIVDFTINTQICD